MSLYLDRKFLLLISARLSLFKEKSADLYNFRCPFCGDSRKNKLKARGYIFKAQDYNGYGYKCWNCNISTNFNNFLKHLDPLVHKEYVMEKFEAEGSTLKFQTEKPKDIPEPVEALVLTLDENDPVGLHQIELKTIHQLPTDHFARVYIEARKIPDAYLDEIFFAPDFKMFLDENFPWHGKDKLKSDDPRVIVFHTDRAGYITNISGRSFTADPKQRYMKVKVVDYKKIFGINKIDLSKKIYLLEGEFDSMFLPNAVASGDANLNGTAEWLFDTFDVEPVLVFDNQPRNKELQGIIEKSIEEGWSVCMFPESFPGKDINDAVIAGLTPKQVQDIIDENTTSELMAQLRFTSWKR